VPAVRPPLRPLLLALLLGTACASQAAHAEVVIIVSGQSPLKSLSTEQLTAIFLGKISALPDGTKVVPVDLAEDSPVRQAFYSTIIGKSVNQIRAYWSRLIFSGKAQPPRSFSEQELKRMIAGHPDWIGYIDSAARWNRVRRLAIGD
jgi:ABC-type phosphate transport system substrate-binding protein